MSELVPGVIPSLLNGVSQQTASLRMTSQGEAQENGLSSPVDGLVKRPPLQHIAKLATPIADVPPHVHVINRDDGEQYSVLVSDGNLQVFEVKTGAEKVVNFPNGKRYLKALYPRDDISLMSVEDYTFVLNRSRLPQMAIPPTRATEYLKAKIRFSLKEIDEPVPPSPVTFQTWALVSAPPADGYRFRAYQLLENETTVPTDWANSLTLLDLRNKIAAFWDTAPWDRTPYRYAVAPAPLPVRLEYRFSDAYKHNDPTGQDVPSGFFLSDMTSLYVVPAILHFNDGSTRTYRMFMYVFAFPTSYPNPQNYFKSPGNRAWGAENAFKGANPFRVSRKLSWESMSVLGATTLETPMLLSASTTLTPPPSGPVDLTLGSNMLAPAPLPHPWIDYPNWAPIPNYTKLF